jgi:hypothetical protein
MREEGNVTQPDFGREQRILNLAVRLQTGEATPDEMREAADSLSYAAGERVGLEHRVRALEQALAFQMRVLNLFDDEDLYDALRWRINNTGNPVEFFIGPPSKGVALTPDNLHILEESLADIERVDVVAYWGLELFSCRILGRGPAEEIAWHIPPPAVELFEAITNAPA